MEIFCKFLIGGKSDLSRDEPESEAVVVEGKISKNNGL